MSRKRITFTILLLCLTWATAMGAITLDGPVPAGPKSFFSGSGAPANGAVELIVNDLSVTQVVADADGKFTFTNVALNPADDIRVQTSFIWDFEDGTVQGWNPNQSTLSVAGGVLTQTLTDTGDPWMNNGLGLIGGSFDQNVYRVVEVRLKNNTDASQLQVFWFLQGAGFINPAFAIEPNMTEFKTYRFSDHTNVNWGAAPVTTFRFDIANATATGTVEYDYIRVNENIALEFDVAGDSEQIETTNINLLNVDNGSLSIEALSGDPWLRLQRTANTTAWQIDMGVFEHVYTGGNWDTSSVQAGWLWTDTSGAWGGPNLLNAAIATTTSYQVVHHDLGAAASWTSTQNPTLFSNQRFDPIQTATAGDTVDIDYIRMTSANPYGPLDTAAENIQTTPTWFNSVITESGLIDETLSIPLTEGVDYGDADGGPVTLSILAGSHVGAGTGDWLTFGTGASSTTLSGTPVPADEGVSTWTLVASDGVSSSTALLSVTVVGPSAVTTVVVDDDATNDAAYVNGVGGNFTGASALKDAVVAVNNDPVLSYSYDIQIIDTDGTTDTYSGIWTAAKARTTVRQVANSTAAADVGVIIDPGADAGSGNLTRFERDGSALIGLSRANPITVVLPQAGNPFIGLSSNISAQGLVFENLRITGGAPGRLAANVASPGTVFRGLTVLNEGIGIQIPGANEVTIEDSFLASSSFPIVALNGAAPTVRNTEIFGDDAPLHLGGVSRIEIVDSYLNWSSTTAANIITAPHLSNDAEILIMNSSVASVAQGLIFNLADTLSSMTIQGRSASEKMDLNTTIGAGTSLLRSRAGTVSFIDCNIGVYGIDVAGNQTGGERATFNFERCIVNAHVGGATTDTLKTINATNTIFLGDGVPLNLDMIYSESGSELNLTHCTFTGAPSTGEFIRAASSLGSIVADYTLFDGTGTDWISANAAPTGDYNLVAAGAAGSFADTTGLTNTVTGDPALSSAGFLSGGGPAYDAAVGSTLLVDVEGDARPIGDANDIGADESVQTTFYGWPIQAVRTASAPTLDGVIDVAGEYSPAGFPVPIYVLENTLNAADPYFTTVTHAGTLFGVNSGSIDNDQDASMTLYFLWDDSALYVAADVKDEALFPKTNPTPGVNTGDCFQLCLDYDQLGASDISVAGTNGYIPSWAAADNVSDSQYFQQFWPLSAPNPMTGTTWAVATSSEGYVVEARIPWTAFTAGGDTYTKPFPPIEGQTANVSPIIDDHDDATEANASFMFLIGDGAPKFADASAFAEMTFVVDPVRSTALETDAGASWVLYR